MCDIIFKFILLNKNFMVLFFFFGKLKYEDICKKLLIDKKKLLNVNKIYKGNYILKFIIIVILFKFLKLKY